MSKAIINIVQIDEGGTNPKTNLFEQPLWELHFDDEDKRILGKSKMEEYISKGYGNTVFQFKRWTANTNSGNSPARTSMIISTVTFPSSGFTISPT